MKADTPKIFVCCFFVLKIDPTWRLQVARKIPKLLKCTFLIPEFLGHISESHQKATGNKLQDVSFHDDFLSG